MKYCVRNIVEELYNWFFFFLIVVILSVNNIVKKIIVSMFFLIIDWKKFVGIMCKKVLVIDFFFCCLDVLMYCEILFFCVEWMFIFCLGWKILVINILIIIVKVVIILK